MAWYLNAALTGFREAVNEVYPSRDKTSDGTIGDEAHQSTNSDHNPDADGSVDAWDMDVNLRSANDAAAIEALKRVFQAHESSKYWIHNDQIASRSNGWRRESYAYAGPNRNRHTQHVHWNTREDHEDSTDPWILEDTVTPADFVKILDDPQVAARMRALPWQYVGGGIPAGTSTLGVLASIHKATAGVPVDLVARLDVILAAALDDDDVTVQLDEAALAEVRAIRNAVDSLPTEADVRDALADFGEGGAAAVRGEQA